MLDESGYGIYPGVLSDAECDALIRVLPGTSAPQRAGTRHLMSNSEVLALATDRRLLQLAQETLGDQAVPFRATLFEKSGRANWLVAWHQDTALPLAARFEASGWGPWSGKAGILYAHAPSWALSRVVALRVHLDGSSVDNGPLKVIPGSHAAGALSDAAIVDYSRAHRHVECVVSRGGVLAMWPLLIHSSSKARVSDPRRVLHIEYAQSLDLAPGIRLAVA